MSKKFYAINRETKARWQGFGDEYLVMYDSGNLAVVEPGWYTSITPLDPKKWKMVVKTNILPTLNMSDEEILKKNGWTMECESPFEIRHEDGSFATENAAKMIVEYFKRGL